MIIKPFNFSLLTRPFEMHNRFFNCTAAICCYSFAKNSIGLLPETEIWKFTEKEIGKDTPLDIVMPKSCGEVLVSGSYFSHSGKIMGGEAGFKVGQLEKKLYIVGNRMWSRSISGAYIFSEPEPFDEMPITYSKAFGGTGYSKNPLGKGFIKNVSGDIYALPNIEDAKHLVTSINDTPDPAGFGPIDMLWPQRSVLSGTYDKEWYKNHYPGLAPDTNPAYFNCAPKDQWNHTFFTGQEEFTFYGMNKHTSVLNGKLPLFIPRCFISLSNNVSQLSEISMNLDTLWFFPHCEKVLMIWHGVHEIGTDDAEDVKHIIAGYEKIGDTARTTEHYLSALNKRLDIENGHFYSIYEKDLIPDLEKPGLQQILTLSDSDENKLSVNQKRRAAIELEKAQKLTDTLGKTILSNTSIPSGIQSDVNTTNLSMEHIENPFDLQNYNPETLIAFIKHQHDEAMEARENALQEAEKRKNQVLKKFKTVCDKIGKDYNQEINKISSQEFVRPVINSASILTKFEIAKKTLTDLLTNFKTNDGLHINLLTADLDSISIAPSIKKLALQSKNAMIENNDAMIENLQKAEEVSKSTYVRYAHTSKNVPVHSSDKMEVLKKTFFSDLEKKSCAGKDYAGIDLSSLDLRNIDFSNSYFEGGNLSNCNLSGANLKGSIFANANLANAILENADASEASFGGAILDSANLTGCKLYRVVLSSASFNKTILNACEILPLDINGASFSKTSFDSAILSDCYFFETEFLNCSFNATILNDIVFYKCNLSDCTFTHTKLPKTQFIETNCSHTNFSNSDLSGSNFVKQCVCSNTKFSGANLNGACLMETDLKNADFSHANLDGANLMKSIASNADFSHCQGLRALLQKANFSDANFTKANLMESNLRKALLINSNLTGTNLYGADLMRITVNKENFKNTHYAMTVLDIQDTK